MKKMVFAAVLLAAFGFANAQSGNNTCVYNTIQTYSQGGSRDDLERGIKCADEASVNESTMGVPKTWSYRGELFTLIAHDTILAKKYGTAGLEAVKAFKKLYDMNDPKFKDWNEVLSYIDQLRTDVFNLAVEDYQAKNYSQAYSTFMAVLDLNAISKAKSKEPRKGEIGDTIILKNSAIMAENASMIKEAIEAYKAWIAIQPTPYAYRSYAVDLKKQDKVDEAKKIIDEGLAKFPKDVNLIVEKINFFLEAQAYTEALTYVNNLLELEPNNDGALFVKGLAYEKIGNEDSVIYYYKKSSEANPKNIKPLNNLGAWYVNKGNPLIEQMNKLGNTAEDQKKYDELKKQVRDLYTKAKPYLEKAKAIAPDDQALSRILKKIESFMAE
jgi:tetratricopeptide (TPR) repeat protein